MSLISRSALEGQLDDPLSCLEVVAVNHTFIINPKFIGDTDNCIKQQLKSWLLLHSDKFDGVPMCFRQVQRMQRSGTIVEDQSFMHVLVRVEAIVFRPHPDKSVEAVVNKIGRDHIGCLVHGHFNASLPKHGQREVNVSDSITFTICKVYTHNGVLSIRGKWPTALRNSSVSSSSMVVVKSEPVDSLLKKTKKKKKHKDKDRVKSKADKTSTDQQQTLLSANALASSSSDTLSDIKPSRKRRRSNSLNSEDSGIGVLSPCDTLTQTNNESEHSRSISSKKKKRKKDKPGEIV